jgi:hypothetical protein
MYLYIIVIVLFALAIVITALIAIFKWAFPKTWGKRLGSKEGHFSNVVLTRPSVEVKDVVANVAVVRKETPLMTYEVRVTRKRHVRGRGGRKRRKSYTAKLGTIEERSPKAAFNFAWMWFGVVPGKNLRVHAVSVKGGV